MSQVNIIAGQIDAGKTARLLSLYNSLPPGTADGLASVKYFSATDGAFLGYRLLSLTTGVQVPFVVLQDRYRREFASSFVFDRFIFSQTAISWGEKILADALANTAIQHIFIDEIGPVELQGQGFAAALKQVLASDKHIYLCINERNIGRVAESFSIDKYSVTAAP